MVKTLKYGWWVLRILREANGIYAGISLFSTVRNADRILVLDEGRIIEEGNHKKLMKENGLYAELFNIQAQGYK